MKCLSSLCHGEAAGCVSCPPSWELSFHWADATGPTTTWYQGRLGSSGRGRPCHQEGLVKSFWQQPTTRLVLAKGTKLLFVSPVCQPAHGKCDLMVARLCGWSPKFVKVAEENLYDVVLSISTRYRNYKFAFCKDSTDHEKCKGTSATSV